MLFRSAEALDGSDELERGLARRARDDEVERALAAVPRVDLARADAALGDAGDESARLDRAARAVQAVDDGHVLTADLDIKLTPVLDDALHKGVPIYFVLDFDLRARNCADEPSMRSPDGTTPTSIQFVNRTDASRRLYLLDAVGVRHWLQTVGPGVIAGIALLLSAASGGGKSKKSGKDD